MIKHIIITSLSVFAIWYSMLEGEIFEKLSSWLSRVLPSKLHSPVFDCPVCMVPWYGSAIYWIFWHVDVQDWILTVLPAMGLNVVIMRLWPKEEIEVMTLHKQGEYTLDVPEQTELEKKLNLDFYNSLKSNKESDY